MAVRKKTVLKQARERLESMKAELLAEIRQDLRAGRETQKDEGRDTYDVASDERERELSLLLSDRERGKLGAIDAALERIEDQTYLECEECGGEIHPDRLKVMPFTRLCVQCQSEREREARHMRPADSSNAFRGMGGSLDLDEES